MSVKRAVAVANSALALNPRLLPRHLAVIMDGNGRWAQSRGMLRTNGHRKGVDAVRDTTTECARLGIARLTLYAFSTENWRRPKREIALLMKLLGRFLVDERGTLLNNGVRLQAIGQIDRLPPAVQQVLAETIALTAGGKRMVLSLALSYGGRDELVQAMRSLAREVQARAIDPSAIDEAAIQAHLFAPEAEDVDCLVRTAGEQRISNFLPWQSVYAEFISLPVLWPDFSVTHLHQALAEFQRRERRFGTVAGISEGSASPEAEAEASVDRRHLAQHQTGITTGEKKATV